MNQGPFTGFPPVSSNYYWSYADTKKALPIVGPHLSEQQRKAYKIRERRACQTQQQWVLAAPLSTVAQRQSKRLQQAIAYCLSGINSENVSPFNMRIPAVITSGLPFS